jgi:hypothetical protein
MCSRFIWAIAFVCQISRSPADPLYAFQPVTPCSGCGALVTGINNAGEITGSVNNAEAFFGVSGNYTVFAEPGAFLTEAIGITNSGRVTVNYLTPQGTGSAYILASNGSKTDLLQLGKVTLGGNENETGVAVGYYGSDFSGAGGVTAFVNRGGVHDSTFVYPGALVTQALNINDAGVVVGDWVAKIGTLPHGFERSASGAIGGLDVPGSIGTEIFDINNAGRLAGAYWDTGGRQHGFVYRDGVYTTIDYTGENTIISGINDLGQIVGASYADGQFFTGPYSGFIATPTPEPELWECLAIAATIIIGRAGRQKAKAQPLTISSEGETRSGIVVSRVPEAGKDLSS